MDGYNSYEEEYEPTEEEWAQIEELIIQEELEELREWKREKTKALNMFACWCKENGIKW